MDIQELKPEDSLICKHDPVHPGEGHEHEYIPTFETASLEGVVPAHQTQFGVVTCEVSGEAYAVIIATSGDMVIPHIMSVDDAIDHASSIINTGNLLAELCAIKKRLVFHVVTFVNAPPDGLAAMDAALIRKNEKGNA